MPYHPSRLVTIAHQEPMHLPDNILHVFVVVGWCRLGILKVDHPGLIFMPVGQGVLDTAPVSNLLMDRSKVTVIVMGKVIVMGAVVASVRIASF